MKVPGVSPYLVRRKRALASDTRNAVWTFETYWSCVVRGRARAGSFTSLANPRRLAHIWLRAAELCAWARLGRYGHVPEEWEAFRELAADRLTEGARIDGP